MAKLFPPLIEGTIPAFYSDEGTVKITVPFSMNRAVSKKQVSGFVLKAKTVQSSTYLFTIRNQDSNTFNMEDSPWVTFTLSPQDISYLRVGQFYKFQIAYIDNAGSEGEIGYYSTIATGKYTKKPTLYISTANTENGLKVGQINMHHTYYMGYYGQVGIGADSNERVYSYEFNVYDSDGKLFATSGEQLHNSSSDMELYESYDNFSVPQELEVDKSYYIQYKIKTINNLELSTPKYRIMKKTSIETEMEAKLSATLNYENGYVDIDLIGTKNQFGLETPVTGAFLITRACSDNNYGVWHEISRFKLQAQNPSRWLWRDFTVEQGKYYKYAIQQYNDAGLYSERLESNKIYVDFEDAFLYDGYRQLKIKFNPKMSSLKINTLENKMDTIGSRHPFIFRNGNVYYREFPISGLISYLMDEEKIFMSKEETMGFEITTNLTSENLAQERLFKTRVHEWLTDGNPKVFRSPTEGNFIVRLLNVSLTPNDQIGRMLHTFNCTAYEIADFNYDELSRYNFIHVEDPEATFLRFKTVNFYETKDGVVTYKHGQMNTLPAVTVRIDNMMPGDILQVIKSNGDMDTISIGVTGSYYIDTGTEITAIIVPTDVDSNGNYIYNYTGSMTYSYYSISQNLFNKIDNVNVIEYPSRQFIGEHNILQEIEGIKIDGQYESNPKIELLNFFWIHASKRPVEKIVYSAGSYYTDMNCKIKLTNPDPFTLYAVGTWVLDKEYGPYHQDYKFNLAYYIDFNTNTRYKEYDATLYMNENPINLEDIVTYSLDGRFGVPTTFTIGNGVMLECAYQIREVIYLIESDDVWNTKLPKKEYEDAVNIFAEWQEECELNQSSLDALYEANNIVEWTQQITALAQQEKQYRSNIDFTYKNFIKALINDQKEQVVSEAL